MHVHAMRGKIHVTRAPFQYDIRATGVLHNTKEMPHTWVQMTTKMM